MQLDSPTSGRNRSPPYQLFNLVSAIPTFDILYHQPLTKTIKARWEIASSIMREFNFMPARELAKDGPLFVKASDFAKS
jgi:hypothetical protein